MKKLLLPFIFSVSLTSATAQQVVDIQFEGLKKTKESYLSQFLGTKVGDRLDSTLLEIDRVRLTSIESLANVQFEVEQVEKGCIVLFRCNELYTLLPIFSFGGIEENFWVQAGISEANLAGYGHKLTAYYQYYDRSSFAMHLTLDRIRQSSWGANFNLVKWSTLEPLFFEEGTVEYEYDNLTLGATAVKHFGFNHKLEFGGAYFTEDYTKSTEGIFEGAPEQLKRRKVLAKVLWTENRINYHFFYLDGIRNQLNVETVQSLDDDPAFYIVFNDFSYFKRIKARGNWGSRIRVGLSSNEESPFAPFVLDSYVNIRGVGNRVDRGTGAIVLNAEYRHTCIDKDKLAVQAVAFSDLGSWRNPGGDFSDFSNPDNFVLFGGGGIRFIHKKIYNAILRIDYGFNLQETSSNGFVLGIGQYF